MLNPISLVKNEIQQVKEIHANRKNSVGDSMIWSGRIMTYSAVVIGTVAVIKIAKELTTN